MLLRLLTLGIEHSFALTPRKRADPVHYSMRNDTCRMTLGALQPLGQSAFSRALVLVEQCR